MNIAMELANENVVSRTGGPFGAVIVKDGQIISVGRNEVTGKNDPTAHAEIQAIREACSKLNSFQLTDCEIYTNCEPCPMCLGAIYWARPKAVYYTFSRKEAADIGFDDNLIYEQLRLPIEKRLIPMNKLENDKNLKNPFELWEKSKNKVEY